MPFVATFTPPGNEESDSLIVLHYNYTGKLILREKATDRIGLTTVSFLIICSFIVLENLMVLIAIWKNNKFHNRMYFFIGNLALCDLLAGIVYKVNILMSGKRTLSLSYTIWFIREGSMFVALERSMALLRTVVIVVGVFIACWSPLFILLLIDVACRVKECAILYKADWFIALAVLNSAMNPIIYTLASKEMRRAFFRLVCGCLVKTNVSRSLPIQPTPDQSRSKSSSSNAQKPKDDFPQVSVPSSITEKDKSSFQNGNLCK
ncbi:sphingosine-1-phosphate receptor 3 [Chelydra serpentina]|uniref:Sphingosine-1-phosphate receptor 3 n=1 Tax=Chelydra serpentina TaxID=8475 RepID=A0A8T1T6A3_CHESE|nr:sphingosine-1-phosphate receptor 3 [Chelydra serpentina]